MPGGLHTDVTERSSALGAQSNVSLGTATRLRNLTLVLTAQTLN